MIDIQGEEHEFFWGVEKSNKVEREAARKHRLVSNSQEVPENSIWNRKPKIQTKWNLFLQFTWNH
jgi:hypothetical protein